MGSGGNELPLGRELRMNFKPLEGAGASGGPKSAQQPEPQLTATVGDSARAPPAIELPKEEGSKQQQSKDAGKAANAERKPASKAVGSEKKEQARKRKKKAQKETRATADGSKVPQATMVSIYFACSGLSS